MASKVEKIVCMPTQCYEATQCYDIPRRFFGIMYVELDGLRSRKWNSERVVGSVSVSYIATYPMC